MRYHVLACDYDGTIAFQGRVGQEVLKALERLKASGRKLILVTGREMDDILRVFPEIEVFERVVSENGAVLYDPASRKETVFGERPPDRFIRALQERSVQPLSWGRVIVGTFQPNEMTVLETIRDLGLELQVVFNKGAVMVLPSGINKASGLRAALEQMEFSYHNTVGIGDGENDQAFLDLCEFSTAVANALPSVKERADWVTAGERGEGVIELAERLLDTDLRERDSQLIRHTHLLGVTEEGRDIRVPPYGKNILVSGSSGSGKSTFATGFLEQLLESEYQFCIVDPEGDYSNFEKAVVLGSQQSPPAVQEIMKLLSKPDGNVVVNLLAVLPEDRPQFLQTFLPLLFELRVRTGRPHWILMDEIHHMAPSSSEGSALILDQDEHSTMMITIYPAHVSRQVVSAAEVIVAIGDAPGQVFRDFSEMLGEPVPSVSFRPLERGEAMAWFRHTAEPPVLFNSVQPEAAHQRHLRKYAEGDLGPERSFYFRGPEGKLNLRAQNLVLFMQLAEGVDDETWEYHLRNGDISCWFRQSIKDDDLAASMEEIEKKDPPAKESRALVKRMIEERYTLPA